MLTEAGSKRRASLHVVSGEESLHAFDAGGIDVFAADLEAFRAVLTAENHTLKRALTDPRLLSGIGNAYSDEILHAAQLSPLTLTNKLKHDEWERLFAATRSTLQLWTDRLRPRRNQSFLRRSPHFARRWPSMDGMVSLVQDAATRFCAFDMRIKRRTIAHAAKPEEKYWQIAACQRLLGSDWPRTLEELEALKRR